MPRVVAAAVALLLAGVALLGPVPLLVAVLAAQAVLSLAWLSLTSAADVRVSLPALLAAGLASDLLALRDGGISVARTMVVVALGFVVALVAELFRRDRTRVTESLAATVTGVVLVTLAAGLVAARAQPEGERVALAALGGVAVACLVRGLVPHRALGAVAGAVLAPLAGIPGGPEYVAVAAGCGIAAVVAATGVELSRADAGRRGDAVRPLGVVVPVALAGPVAYGVSRLLLA